MFFNIQRTLPSAILPDLFFLLHYIIPFASVAYVNLTERLAGSFSKLVPQSGSRQDSLVILPESLKAATTATTGGGTFWTSGEHFVGFVHLSQITHL